jgi:anaerobic selenocysteine-containing dehydrogenase
MATDDAAPRNRDGATVRVSDDRGGVAHQALVTDRVMRGTLVAPFGHWQHDGASANALTSDTLGDIGSGPTFCEALVDVAPAES